MPTGSVLLSPGAATLPDGSTNNAAPAIQRVKSSAAAPTPHFLQLAFADSIIERAMWSFRMPADYSSAPALKVQYKMASAMTGTVVVDGRVAAVSDGDATDVDAKAFAAANTANMAVPLTLGNLDEVSVSLINNDSLAAGDFVVVYLARLGDNILDTASGDMEVVAVALIYSTA